MYTPPSFGACLQTFSSVSAGFHWPARNQVGKAPWAFDPLDTIHPDFVRRGQQVRLVPAGEESVVRSMQENDLGYPPLLQALAHRAWKPRANGRDVREGREGKREA